MTMQVRSCSDIGYISLASNVICLSRTSATAPIVTFAVCWTLALEDPALHASSYAGDGCHARGCWWPSEWFLRPCAVNSMEQLGRACGKERMRFSSAFRRAFSCYTVRTACSGWRTRAATDRRKVKFRMVLTFRKCFLLVWSRILA